MIVFVEISKEDQEKIEQFMHQKPPHWQNKNRNGQPRQRFQSQSHQPFRHLGFRQSMPQLMQQRHGFRGDFHGGFRVSMPGFLGNVRNVRPYFQQNRDNSTVHFQMERSNSEQINPSDGILGRVPEGLLGRMPGDEPQKHRILINPHFRGTLKAPPQPGLGLSTEGQFTQSPLLPQPQQQPQHHQQSSEMIRMQHGQYPQPLMEMDVSHMQVQASVCISFYSVFCLQIVH